MSLPSEAEDSEDLTDEEVAQAIETLTMEEFSVHLIGNSRTSGRPLKQELRRKRPHLYCRTTFVDKVLLFRVDWLQQ